MSTESKDQKHHTDSSSHSPSRIDKLHLNLLPPLPNYTLSTVCPACSAPIYRHACKARCPRCGFMWDCSEV